MLAAGIDVFSTRERPAPESLNDQRHRAERDPRARDDPRRGPRPRRRGRADRHHARGAARAPARRQDLPAPSGSTRRSTTSSGSRTWPRCARSRCARSPRRSGPSASTTELVGSREERLAAAAPQAVGERLLALVEPLPGQSQRLVRRAWRSAQRLGAELDLLWVQARAQARRRTSSAARRAAPARVGARRALLVEESDDIAAAVVDVARGARHHLHPDRARRARARPGAPAHAAAAAPDGAASRRRRADRRRSLQSFESPDAPMSAASIVHHRRRRHPRGIAAGYWLPPHGRLPARNRPRPVRRILLPFTGQAISRRSFEAAVRLAKAENATVMPAFLARVPMNLPLEIAAARAVRERHAAARGRSSSALSAQGVPFDSRVGRGRSARDALRKLLDEEHSTASSCPPTKTRRQG